MKRTSLAQRKAAERRGRWGEVLASMVLLAKGYRILGRRIRTHLGEIDLVARSPGGVICFVEVKVRGHFVEAVEAVLPRQQARIARAAEVFLAQRPHLANRPVRFDAIAVARGKLPRHLRDVWQP